MSIYDLLDIDETEGVDQTEIAAIKATLLRIKNSAALVAKDNDTSDTLAILKEVERVVNRVVGQGVHSVDELHQQLATNSSGQPVAALGSGSSSTSPITDENAALDIIMRSATVPQGVKAAIMRIVAPTDPNHIRVEPDGTPSELVSTRSQRDTEKADKETAIRELAEERDSNKRDSLAHKLAVAQGTDMIAKSVVLTKVTELETKAEALKSTMGSWTVDGKDEIKAGLASLKNSVS